MTETKLYEPARLSNPPKPLFSLKTAGRQTGWGHCCLRSSEERSARFIAQPLSALIMQLKLTACSPDQKWHENLPYHAGRGRPAATEWVIVFSLTLYTVGYFSIPILPPLLWVMEDWRPLSYAEASVNITREGRADLKMTRGNAVQAR